LYVPAGGKATAEFSVTADGAALKILRVEGGTARFVSRLVVVEPGRSYKIIVESLPSKAGGFYLDRLRVITDNATLPAFTLGLTLKVYDKQ